MGAYLTGMAVRTVQCDMADSENTEDESNGQHKKGVSCCVALCTQYPCVGESALVDFVSFEKALRESYSDMISPLQTYTGDREVDLFQLLESNG